MEEEARRRVHRVPVDHQVQEYLAHFEIWTAWPWCLEHQAWTGGKILNDIHVYAYVCTCHLHVPKNTVINSYLITTIDYLHYLYVTTHLLLSMFQKITAINDDKWWRWQMMKRHNNNTSHGNTSLPHNVCSHTKIQLHTQRDMAEHTNTHTTIYLLSANCHSNGADTLDCFPSQQSQLFVGGVSHDKL